MSLKRLLVFIPFLIPAYTQAQDVPVTETVQATGSASAVTTSQRKATRAKRKSIGKTKTQNGFMSSTGRMITDSRDMVSDRVILLANKVDGLFGNDRALDEYYKSSLKITTTSFYNANQGTFDNNFSTSLTLSLPNLKERERAFNDYWTRKPDQPPTSVLDEDFVSLEEFKEQNPWDLATETGIRWKWPIAYFGKLRLSRTYLTDKWVDYWQNEIGWDSEALWSSKVAVTSDYAFSSYFLFRFLNQANWYMSEPSVFGTVHGPSWIYSFEDKSLFSFDLRFLVRSYELELYGDGYAAGFTYRTGFKKVPWVFLELTPVCSWSLADGFTPTTSINLRLDFLFGREKTTAAKPTNPLDIL
ncbi:hypothetical protein [Bdellovibrio sp. HCB274]|uniref:hypothetical protein n=1 Tax=Bdellovibrio sp. HCB274 TaxID=3394361 RepID=UPI0039B50F75